MNTLSHLGRVLGKICLKKVSAPFFTQKKSSYVFIILKLFFGCPNLVRLCRDPLPGCWPDFLYGWPRQNLPYRTKFRRTKLPKIWDVGCVRSLCSLGVGVYVSFCYCCLLFYNFRVLHTQPKTYHLSKYVQRRISGQSFTFRCFSSLHSWSSCSYLGWFWLSHRRICHLLLSWFWYSQLRSPIPWIFSSTYFSINQSTNGLRVSARLWHSSC